MANRFTIRHGASAPSSNNLLEYELGYDRTGEKLYIRDGSSCVLINDDSSIVNSGSGNAVTNISANGHILTVNKDTTFLTTHQDISGKENTSNKVSSWSSTTNNTRYPSEKLVKDSLDNIVNLIYPVGSIYMSVNSTSPATLFGGTWTRIEDKFLLSAGTTYGAGTTGGNANHTPSGSVSTTVNDHTLTISEIPKHSHTNYSAGSNYGSGSIFGAVQLGEAWAENTTGKTGGGGGHNHGATSTFTGTSQNTMPPYLAVYMWKRTA